MDGNDCSIQFGEEDTARLTIKSVDQSIYKVKVKVTKGSCNRLPSELVIKPRTNPDEHDTFEREGQVYRHLSDLQGWLIPRYFGVAKFHHAQTTVDAHIIEQIDGTALTDYTGNILDLKEMIFEAYKKLSAKGVIHRDVELRHIFIGPQHSLTLIDFGMAKICENLSDAGLQNSADVAEIFERHKLHLRYKPIVEAYFAGRPLTAP